MWNYSFISEVTIARPARDIWPYLFGKKNAAWSRTAYTIVAGEEGKVGYTYSMASFGESQLYFETIRAKPEKEMVLKILWKDNPKSEPRLAGYDFFTLTEQAGRTKVLFLQGFELPVEPQSEKHDEFLAEILQNLKRMVEQADATE